MGWMLLKSIASNIHEFTKCNCLVRLEKPAKTDCIDGLILPGPLISLDNNCRTCLGCDKGVFVWWRICYNCRPSTKPLKRWWSREGRWRRYHSHRWYWAQKASLSSRVPKIKILLELPSSHRRKLLPVKVFVQPPSTLISVLILGRRCSLLCRLR